MSLTEIARVGELADNQMKRVEVDGRKLLLCFSQDQYFLVDEMCSHEDYSLYLGCVREGRIKCSLHGSWFDLASGKAQAEPAHEPIRTHKVQVEAGRILASL